MNVSDRDRPLIALIAGARPNFMKIAPILRELSKYTDMLRYELVHTGQHYDHGMSDVFFQELNIPKPDCYLEAGGGTHAQQTAKIMVGFEGYCEQAKPQLVIVVGDVNSTLACTIVAKKLRIQVAHVEAGLRSGDMTMPEEINRIVTDSISDLFFVTEESGVVNLRREGKTEHQIHFVGHVMIDNLLFQVKRLRSCDLTSFGTESYKKANRNYGVVTLHRPSNVDSFESLRAVVDILQRVSQRLPLVFVIHPRTAQNLRRFDVRLPATIQPIDPLPYMEFLNLWIDAKVVLTDSGGLQEETTALNVPCITLRENTERPITISHGTNILTGIDPDRVISAVDAVIDGVFERREFRPPLWDGCAAQRIVEIVRAMMLHPSTQLAKTTLSTQGVG